ncbi:MAG: RNA polymerase sigma factor [Lachnospiraceae bacterium]|nr:RNA polymerase sigma factor [Lachnospiraceae bacterium]MBR6152552.1 RNA polymerase sigma factor [Lachnospiraceae bacterium]
MEGGELLEDGEIVDLYLARNENAIMMTEEKYGRSLRKIISSVLDDEACKECENDVYLRAWNLIPPNEPRDHFFAFLGKLARNLAIDEWRRTNAQKRKATMIELSEELQECMPAGNSVEGEILSGELKKTINSFLSTKSQTERKIFLRRYWYFDTVPEISNRYGYTQGKVKSALHRMRGELKGVLEKEGYFYDDN